MGSAKSLPRPRRRLAARVAKRRVAAVKPLVPAYEPRSDSDGEDVERLLLEAARARVNRALSE